jgi:Fe-S-cluster-containing hydrogenase component 2
MAMVTAEGTAYIRWEERRCTGCLTCVIVCSERHTGTSAPSRARIVIFVDPLTGELAGGSCQQCAEALCANACPEETIQFDPRLGAWLVADARCTGCGLCVDACSFGSIRLDPVTALPIKCDLCRGATRCVEACPAQALSVEARGEEASGGR